MNRHQLKVAIVGLRNPWSLLGLLLVWLAGQPTWDAGVARTGVARAWSEFLGNVALFVSSPLVRLIFGLAALYLLYRGAAQTIAANDARVAAEAKRKREHDADIAAQAIAAEKRMIVPLVKLNTALIEYFAEADARLSIAEMVGTIHTLSEVLPDKGRTHESHPHDIPTRTQWNSAVGRLRGVVTKLSANGAIGTFEVPSKAQSVNEELQYVDRIEREVRSRVAKMDGRLSRYRDTLHVLAQETIGE